MKLKIGKTILQKKGYKAFVPDVFPPKGLLELPNDLIVKAVEAERLVGKLDGITHTLPDVDFLLKMFVTKDATSSSQIEGTRATIVDALEKNVGVATKETDADDILYYIKALNYGVARLQQFPMSLRFIREIHSQLMTGARASHFADPGEFRQSQNWIGGTSPSDAIYVPPPVVEMKRALIDFERFLRDDQQTIPLVHMALMHAQFETIHPFLDGNGRTGRILITLSLCQQNLLEKPVLFLSSYFKKHQKQYYLTLHGYHDGKITEWLRFFLDGVAETAQQSISVSKEITRLRDTDIAKITALAKRESQSGVLVLSHLYAQPIVSTRVVMEWTGFTRAGAQRVIDRFVSLDILQPREAEGTYDRTYVYKKYLDIFTR